MKNNLQKTLESLSESRVFVGNLAQELKRRRFTEKSDRLFAIADDLDEIIRGVSDALVITETAPPVEQPVFAPPPVRTVNLIH